ncbi:MAG: molybdenum ABC transporter ATP-binding protein [Burkholderiaceae bacterium]
MSAVPGLRVKFDLARGDFDLSVDLRLPAKGITVLFGASGSGKTSILRVVAGLERGRNGRVEVAGETWQDDDAAVFLPTWRRPLGYVFQEASLFEHLDVQANLEFGVRRTASRASRDALAAAVELLGIGALLRRHAHQLSGGERQRIAIARALATQPRLLLLDEPLAAIDHARRQEILPWLERLRDESQVPMLYVTHAPDEVARLADTLVVLERGQIKAVGPAAAVLSAIDSPVVVGEDAGALLAGEVLERDPRWHLARVGFAGGTLWVRDSGLAVGARVRLRVLARDLSLATDEPQRTSIQNHFPARILAIAPDLHPSQALVQLACGPSLLLARVTRRALAELGLGVGDTVWAQVKAVALIA